MDIELVVYPTKDLEGDILRFCPEIEVLSPPSLRESIATRIQQGLTRLQNTR